MRQTTFMKAGDLEPKWFHVDAEGQRLGRISVQIATVLMGKHRPEYTPHIDTGDFIVVTNAEKIVLTGRKGAQKLKLRYSGHPGGLKARTYDQVLERKPESLLEDSVRRMLPKGRLGRKMLGKLKVYRGTEHPHSAQQPTAMPKVC